MKGRRIGFTTRASCLLAAGFTAVLCGIILGERDLMRAGVLAMAVPLLAAVVVRGSQLRLGNRRSIDPVRANSGEPVTVHLTISNRSPLPTGSLMLEDHLPDDVAGHARFVLDPLRSHESRTVSYRVPGLGRGRYRVGPLRVRLTDPFRMIDITRSFTTASDFVVGPVIEPLGAVDPPRSQDIGENAGSHSIGIHGADDASTREYRTGDDLRKVHWRSSARTGALMVRQEERPWQGQATILLDVRAEAHERVPQRPGLEHRQADSLEWAISAAASVGVNLLRAGREVSLLADPVDAERIRYHEPLRFVDHLATVTEVQRATLAGLAVPVRSATRDSVVVAILGRLDARSLQALADAHPRGWSAPALAILLDVAGWGVDPASDLPTPTDPATDAAAVVLRQSGWRVTVARRGAHIPTVWRIVAGSASPAAAMQ